MGIAAARRPFEDAAGLEQLLVGAGGGRRIGEFRQEETAGPRAFRLRPMPMHQGNGQPTRWFSLLEGFRQVSRSVFSASRPPRGPPAWTQQDCCFNLRGILGTRRFAPDSLTAPSPGRPYVGRGNVITAEPFVLEPATDDPYFATGPLFPAGARGGFPLHSLERSGRPADHPIPPAPPHSLGLHIVRPSALGLCRMRRCVGRRVQP